MDISFALEVYDREIERGRVEQVLRESEERFRQLAENIQEVFWMTANNQILYVSPAYERIWGRTRSSLYESPRSWLDAIHPDDRAQVLRAAKAIQAGGSYDETYRIQRPDGAVRWIHDHAFPVRGVKGEIVRIVGTAEDITERRQLEEQYFQAQKMEAIGQLAGGVAHDFNNLLTVIRGYGSLLLQGEQTPDETAIAAQEIVRAAERAANLTRQLLAFSRRQVMQPQSLDLNETVTALTTMLQRILGADVRLQLNPHQSPLMTHADAGMLDQVLMNLVLNACDAMPEGGQILIETTEKKLHWERGGYHTGCEARTIRQLARHGHRMRYFAGELVAHLRPVLHHEATRQRNGPRLGHRFWHHQATQRLDPGGQRSGPWHDLSDLSAGGRGYSRITRRRNREARTPRRHRNDPSRRRRAIRADADAGGAGAARLPGIGGGQRRGSFAGLGSTPGL